MERRESEYNCPRCGEQLVEYWDMRDNGMLVGGKEMQRIGRPRCPKGHQLEWTAAGTPA